MNGRSILSETSTLDFFTPKTTGCLRQQFCSVPIVTTKLEPQLFLTLRATPSDALAPFAVLPAESDHTTHFSTIDAAGNAVALTSTLEDSYGAKAVVAGAGFLLNNEMGDFNLIPGRTDTSGRIGTPANIIRPRQTDAQLDDARDCAAERQGPDCDRVTGRPDHSQHHALGHLGVLEFGLDPRAAVDAPRTHHQWFPDVLLLEGESWTETVRAELAAMGHHWRSTDRLGIANTIVVDPSTGQVHGIADRRRSTTKAAGD